MASGLLIYGVTGRVTDSGEGGAFQNVVKSGGW